MILNDLFPEDTAGFAGALLLGDSRGLDYATDTAFKISGIRHIIAVSGLHVSILFALICTVTLKHRYLTALVGFPMLLVFAAVSGFTPSVIRACIMAFLMMMATVFNREYDPPTALAFAVLVMLLVNPMAAASASLQLSALCVTGILLFDRPIGNWVKRILSGRKSWAAKLVRRICSGSSVSLSAMSLVTPLSAAYFGTVSLVSILTNVLTLWAVHLIFNGIVVTCILYLMSPAAAQVLASVVSWLIR